MVGMVEAGTVGELLKGCRHRLSPSSRTLGMCVRAPIRVGKPVTQEEVAEAAGVSRVWFAMMENDRARRISARVLDELATVLGMSQGERAALFQLALPEVRAVSLSERTEGMLNAYQSLRQFTRRLWSATSATEALRTARDYLLREAGTIAAVTFRKTQDDAWEYIDGDGSDQFMETLDLMQQSFGNVGIDDLHCLTILRHPGQLLSQSDRDMLFPKLAGNANQILHRMNLSSSFFTMAHVQGRGGLIARLSMLYKRNERLSDLQRAQLSTIAEITSLAIL